MRKYITIPYSEYSTLTKIQKKDLPRPPVTGEQQPAASSTGAAEEGEAGDWKPRADEAEEAEVAVRRPPDAGQTGDSPDHPSPPLAPTAVAAENPPRHPVEQSGAAAATEGARAPSHPLPPRGIPVSKRQSDTKASAPPAKKHRSDKSKDQNSEVIKRFNLRPKRSSYADVWKRKWQAI